MVTQSEIYPGPCTAHQRGCGWERSVLCILGHLSQELWWLVIKCPWWMWAHCTKIIWISIPPVSTWLQTPITGATSPTRSHKSLCYHSDHKHNLPVSGLGIGRTGVHYPVDRSGGISKEDVGFISRLALIMRNIEALAIGRGKHPKPSCASTDKCFFFWGSSLSLVSEQG